MLERLLKRNVLRETVNNAVKDPLEAVALAVTNLRDGLRNRFTDVTDTIERYKYGVDRNRVNRELRGMLAMDETARREKMRTIFNEALDNNPATFYDLVKALGEIDFFDLVLQSKNPGEELTAEELLLPLQLDHELYTELIQTAQNNPRFKEWMEYVSGKAKQEEKPEGNDNEELKLNGAALPEIFPKINQYVASAMRYAGGSSGHRGDRFEVMVEAFKKITRDIFGKDMDAFFGVATTKNLAGLISRFWSFYPNAELVAGAYEYLPMCYAVSDHNKRHIVDLEDINFTEEDLTKSLFNKGDEIRKDRKVRGIPEREPIVLLVSTQMRIGAKLVDTKKVAQIVETENQRIGYKQYHLWFDSSQDSRVMDDGDIVFFSKRFAGSGGGMVLANNKTYPEDDGKDIKEALRLRSSYDASIIPRLIASLHLTSRKVGHTVSALTHTPGLWHYKGKGTFVAGEIEKARTHIDKSELLSGLFSIESQMPDDPAQWKVDAVLRVVPSDKALQTLNIARLGNDLKDVFHVDCSSFSLDNLRGANGVDFTKLMEALEAEPFRLNKFIEIVEEFQQFYQSWIVKSLLPSNHRENPDHVREYFKQSAKEHNYFRLFITALDRPDYLLDFTKRLEEAVKLQLSDSK
jgi:hypothetical protein